MLMRFLNNSRVNSIWLSIFLMLSINPFGTLAQEFVAPLDHNPSAMDGENQAIHQSTKQKTTLLTLPFFEDFTTSEIFPDPSKWLDRSVYINNTMAINPVSRGVATFDALNELSRPYDTIVFNALVYADSLTSQPIDLSGYTPADSLYLSFFYQPQGNGFSPETQDSLMLYLKKKSGVWEKIWAKEGTTVQPFQQVMIPITDTVFFHDNFSMRFVNKASINLNDDVWNLDYIRLDAGRHMYDTLVDDVATTLQPPFILNDYTAMPYRQFVADMAGSLVSQHHFTVRNNMNALRAIQYGYTAREILSNTPLYSSSLSNTNLQPGEELQIDYPMYSVAFTPTHVNDKVVFEQKYYATTVGGTDSKENDTIVCEQVFDNYLAYDDGTAEKSYFLKQFASVPAKAAVEFYLYESDTIGGAAIYFGRQVPSATNKYFTIEIYQDIAINGGTDQLVYVQDFLFPAYTDTINKFFVYRFDSPVMMPPGKFYFVVVQPANSGSDSLYYGLDVNRMGANYHYYSVYNYWEPSMIQGALMFRPMLGTQIRTTRANDRNPIHPKSLSLMPNPAADYLYLTSSSDLQEYTIMNMLGQRVQQGTLSQNSIEVASLQPGIYIIQVQTTQGVKLVEKFIKK